MLIYRSPQIIIIAFETLDLKSLMDTFDVFLEASRPYGGITVWIWATDPNPVHGVNVVLDSQMILKIGCTTIHRAPVYHGESGIQLL